MSVTIPEGVEAVAVMPNGERHELKPGSATLKTIIE
jgi:hypothetical protein